MRIKLSNKEEVLLKRLKTQYDTVGNPCHERIKVIKDGKYGFVDINGELVIPIKYDWAGAFNRIKLYGKWYVASFVHYQQHKWLIDSNNRAIIQPMDIHAHYFIINDKLWVKHERGYNLISRRGKTLLQTYYQHIINDRCRQPKNTYLVKKEGYFGAIRIINNNQEQTVLPFKFEMCSFWWLPGTGIFILGVSDGKQGLFDLKGNNVVPCKYENFAYATPFRKRFIYAYNEQGVCLYDDTHPFVICSDPYAVIAEYGFYHKKQCYYTAYTTEEEYLLNENSNVVTRLNKRNDISYFHFLMNQQRKQFRFKTLKELLSYCKKVDEITLSHKDKEDIIIYAYFFLEEMLQKYAVQYDLRYTRFGFHDYMQEKRTCWGLCSYQDRRIKLNLSLLLQSEKNIRKTILHELAHLKYPDHKKEFYEFLSKLLGANNQEARKKYKGKINFLETENWFAIIKQKKSELFALAEQGILQKTPSRSSHNQEDITKPIGKLKECNEVAAMEIK